MLEEKYYQPLGAHLARIPKGRKGYNGRVERSHRSDDEELYIPFLLEMHGEQELLEKAAGWEYFYNLVRPHYGKGMGGKTPFEKLKESGYDLPEEFAVFPPIILDTISTDWLLETGNDLLAHYKFGQGSNTAMSQIAAEELGLTLDHIVLVSADSELCSIDIGGFLSAGIFASGEAVRRAAADAKRQLLVNAAEILEAKIDDLHVNNGHVLCQSKPGKTLSFSEIVRNSIQKRNADSIIGKGFCKPVPEIEFYPSLSKGTGRFTDAYGFAVAIAKVEVDPETARVKVLEVTIADDCGFGINPLNVHGRLLSQAVMGTGDALFEEIVTKDGRIINPSFADYKIPEVFDIPKFRHIPVESIEPKGPFGGKEVGQCSRAAVIAAIANAVSDAIGIRIYSLPITPEKIFEALESKGR